MRKPAQKGFERLFGFGSKESCSSVGPIPIAVLLGLYLAARIAANHLFPLFYLEIPFLRDNFLIGFDNYGPPLQPSLFRIWVRLCGVLGLGLELHWLRLPNLILGFWLIVSMIRLGHTVKAPWAGFWAAFLLSFLVVPFEIGSLQAHYYLEMVTTTWFLERWVQYIVARRAVYRSLAFSAVLAMWSGYMPVLIVGPGMVWFLIESGRRSQIRSGLLTLLAITSGFAPILGTALDQALAFLTFSDASIFPASSLELAGQVWGHPIQDSKMSFPSALVRGITGLLQIHAAWLIVLGLSLVNLSRVPVFYGMLLMILIFFLGDAHLSTGLQNHTSIWPILVFLPLWSLERTQVWFGQALFGQIAQIVGVTVLVASNWIHDENSEIQFFRGGDIFEITTVIETSPATEKNVVLLDANNAENSDVFGYSLCRTAGNLHEYIDCGGTLQVKIGKNLRKVAGMQVYLATGEPEGNWTEDNDLDEFSVFSGELFLEGDDDSDKDAEGDNGSASDEQELLKGSGPHRQEILGGIPDTNRWRRNGFFVVLHDSFRDGATNPLPSNRCMLMTRSIGYHLYWCEPQVSVSAKQ